MFYIQVPVADMREKPRRDAKVASQALFGEQVELIQRVDDWSLITTPDQYPGWIHTSSLTSRNQPYLADLEVTRLAAHLYSVPDVEFGPLMTLPFGVKLLTLSKPDLRWIEVQCPNGTKAFIQQGDVTPQPFSIFQFLGLPYTWGGRSSFGFDCSGFIQMLYGRLGLSLPRDANQQVLDAQFHTTGRLEPGDLIFWGFSEKEIKHVGIFLGEDQFIHTSSKENKPYLRLSKLTDFEWCGKGHYPYRTYRAMIQKKAKAMATLAPISMNTR